MSCRVGGSGEVEHCVERLRLFLTKEPTRGPRLPASMVRGIARLPMLPDSISPAPEGCRLVSTGRVSRRSQFDLSDGHGDWKVCIYVVRPGAQNFFGMSNGWLRQPPNHHVHDHVC
jgi:hypothetical protein